MLTEPDVTGESVRSAIVDDQVGVPLYLDIQIVDVNTCKPIKGTMLELWSKSTVAGFSVVPDRMTDRSVRRV